MMGETPETRIWWKDEEKMPGRLVEESQVSGRVCDTCFISCEFQSDLAISMLSYHLV